MNEEQAGKLYDAIRYMLSIQAGSGSMDYAQQDECRKHAVSMLRECFEEAPDPCHCASLWLGQCPTHGQNRRATPPGQIDWSHVPLAPECVVRRTINGKDVPLEPEGAPPIPEKPEDAEDRKDAVVTLNRYKQGSSGFVPVREWAIPDKEPEAPWRPIESAPKDGTRVLLWTVGPEVGSFERDYWFSSGNWLIHPKYWQPIVKPSQTTVELTAPTEKGSALQTCECGHPRKGHDHERGSCLETVVGGEYCPCGRFRPRVSAPIEEKSTESATQQKAEIERLKTEVAGGKFAFESLDAVFQLALAEAQGERDAARNECDELKARLSARRDPAK